MAVNAFAPRWLTWAVAVALVAIFIGERPFGDHDLYRYLLSGIGVAVVAAAVIWRLISWSRSDGEQRRVERILLWGYVGIAVATVLYGMTLTQGESDSRIWGVLAVLWPIIMACAIVPTLMTQIGTAGVAGAETGGALVEGHRVADLASSGLSITLATAFLFTAVYIATERDKKVDVSYFKTSSPGSATVSMVNSLDEPLRVLLFFPPVNQVKDEVSGYFQELAAETNKVEIESRDRLIDAKMAKDYRVTKDGAVVLVKGDQNRTISLDTEIRKARKTLVDFDTEVQKAFMKVARAARTAYFIVGHGELNDPATARGPSGRDPFFSVKAVRDLLRVLNYRVKDLGLRQGLAQEVPDDATVLFLLGPTKPLLESELAAIDRYLVKGGALLAAFEPNSDTTLGPVARRLGVKLNPTLLVDDKQFVPRRRNISDRANLVTDQFSSHASITTLSRARVGAPLVLLGSASLEDESWADDYGKNPPKRTYVIRSLKTTFRDEDGNFSFTEGTEKRQSYNLIAAIEGPTKAKTKKPEKTPEGENAPEPEKPEEEDESDKQMRALLISDAQVFTDGVLVNIPLSRGLIMDAVKWLGGEEEFAGEVKSEKDRPIKHTKDKDVVWFYSTIFGAPIIVLGLGLLFVTWRRRRASRRVS